MNGREVWSAQRLPEMEECSSQSNRYSKLQTSQLHQSMYQRLCYSLIVLLSFVNVSDCSGALPINLEPQAVVTGSIVKCFTTEKGVTIPGSEYRRVRNVDLRNCAMECREDFSCLAFEWGATSETCYLKARSLSGEMERKEETVAGFCIDEDDESRDRFLDHAITGPIVSKVDEIEGDNCRAYCMQQPTATVYSWRPADPEDDEASFGTCTCLESIRGLHLQYNSFSGFFQPRKTRRSTRLHFRK